VTAVALSTPMEYGLELSHKSLVVNTMESPDKLQLLAAVIIPVKNGGDLLVKVLSQLLIQNCPWPYEILVIDSGSTDGSQQKVADLGIRLYEIPAAEFGHGRTRNLGMQLTSADYVCFLTQDALPADDTWLVNMVAVLSSRSDIAGCFGPHRPYPECHPIVAKELQLHFAGFAAQDKIVRLDDPQRYAADAGYRQQLHYFSNNNSAIRRSVWQKIPFPDVDFAEDQIWAKHIIEAGYAKAYAPDAPVYHSHSFGVLETCQRAFDESSALHRIFGYVLTPNLLHLTLNLMRFIHRDWFWLIKDKNLKLKQKILLCLTAPPRNFARLLGYYLGGKTHRLSPRLVGFISRDKTLQRTASSS